MFNFDLKENDYVIISDKQGRKILNDLYRVFKVGSKNTTFERVSEIEALEKSERLMLYPDDLAYEILVNLGPKLPRTSATCFHVLMRAIYKEYYCKPWGNVFWFHDYGNNPIRDDIDTILTDCHAKLKNYDLTKLFPFQTHVYERFEGNKLAGQYMRLHDKPFDVIKLYISPTVDNGGLTHDTVYHEYAHGLWHYCMSDKLKSRWIKLYTDSISVKVISEEDVRTVAEELMQCDKVSELKRKYKDSDVGRVAVNTLITFFKQYHNMTTKEIDTLLKANEDLTVYLEDKELFKGLDRIIDTGVTPYSNKNVVEFFCESFALYLDDMPLPPAVEELTESSIDEFTARQMEEDDE